MKRILCALILSLVLISVGASAQTRTSAMSSGVKTSDTAIATGRSLLTGILLLTDGTNNASIIIYDAASATGTVLFKLAVPGAGNFGGATFEIPIRAQIGIYADVTGTGASYIIYYDKQ